MHAQAVATQLMIDLCGASVAPGTIDVGLKAADWVAGGLQLGLREARVQAILGVPVSARAPGRDPERARLRNRAAARTASR